jgi:hypothetical protein
VATLKITRMGMRSGVGAMAALSTRRALRSSTTERHGSNSEDRRSLITPFVPTESMRIGYSEEHAGHVMGGLAAHLW